MSVTHLIVGLGNPGANYRDTRHNAGFIAIEALARFWGGDLAPAPKFEAVLARAEFAGQSLLLCQPQTFMNVSGRSVAKLFGFYKLEIANLVVIVDDADLELGMIRLRRKGSSGGHNGLKSIAKSIGTEDYARLKIGIGRRDSGALHGHVLGRFRSSERDLLDRVMDRVVDQVQTVITDGIETAMNRYNGPITREKE